MILLACSLQKYLGHEPPRKAEELVQIEGDKRNMTKKHENEIIKRCG